MSTTCFAWLSLLFPLVCLHGVFSEKLQFLNIPQSRREILAVGANLTINCTTNNQTAQTAVYYRRRIKSVKWKKIEAIPGKVIHNGSVYTLLGITRDNKGQYKCRAWTENTNSTAINWPDNVGVVLVRGGLDKGSRKPDSKVQGNRKPGHKKTGNKKPIPEKKRPKKGRQKPRPKKPKPNKQGNKKPDKKRDGRKKPGQKPRKGSKKPGVKRPGHKRGGTKRPGRKQTGTKRPGKKRAGLNKPSKQGPKLKVLNDTVTIIEGSLAVLKCIAQLRNGKQPIISWYRAKRLIGCSNKKSLGCSSLSRRYVITYKIRTTRGGNRKKLTSYLRIPKTRRARDHNTYVCVAKDRQGSTRKKIRLKIKKRSS